MRRAKHVAAGLCIAAASVAAGGCGVDIGAGGSPAAAALTATRADANRREQDLRAASLPKRGPGLLAIAGGHRSLSSSAVTAFSAAQRQVSPGYSAVGPAEGFARLCRGEVDVMESSRPISSAELAACNANGLEIRPPIQIASDAIVVATRNESDVGGDCLTVDDMREIYRRGSPIDNWSRLGFDDLPLTATGPNQAANTFSFFAARVLAVPSGASLNALRGDYVPQGSDAAIRSEITGEDRARRIRGIVDDELRRARKEASRRRQAYVGTAVVAARDRVLRAIRAANLLRARRHEAVGDPAGLARRNVRRVNAAKRSAADSARRTFDRRFDILRAIRTRELLARARHNGVVGLVRFSSYVGFEDKLRPLEIDPGPAGDAAIAAADELVRAAGTAPPTRPPSVDRDGNRIPNCVFPSQQTITTGEYPLSRRILLYTSATGLERPEVRAFLAYALRSSQQLAIRSRLVPITNRLRADQYRFVTGTPIAADEPANGTHSGTTTTPPSQATTHEQTPSSLVPGVSSGVSATRRSAP